MFYRHQTPAERAHSAVAWAALFELPPRAPCHCGDCAECGFDKPLTGRALFLAERQERIDSDLDWSGDPDPEVWP